MGRVAGESGTGQGKTGSSSGLSSVGTFHFLVDSVERLGAIDVTLAVARKRTTAATGSASFGTLSVNVVCVSVAVKSKPPKHGESKSDSTASIQPRHAN